MKYFFDIERFEKAVQVLQVEDVCNHCALTMAMTKALLEAFWCDVRGTQGFLPPPVICKSLGSEARTSSLRRGMCGTQGFPTSDFTCSQDSVGILLYFQYFRIRFGGRHITI